MFPQSHPVLRLTAEPQPASFGKACSLHHLYNASLSLALGWRWRLDSWGGGGGLNRVKKCISHDEQEGRRTNTWYKELISRADPANVMWKSGLQITAKRPLSASRTARASVQNQPSSSTSEPDHHSYWSWIQLLQQGHNSPVLYLKLSALETRPGKQTLGY